MYTNVIDIKIPYHKNNLWEKKIRESCSYIVSYLETKIHFYRITDKWVGKIIESSNPKIKHLNISGIKSINTCTWTIYGNDIISFIREFVEEIDNLYYLHEKESDISSDDNENFINEIPNDNLD